MTCLDDCEAVNFAGRNAAGVARGGWDGGGLRPLELVSTTTGNVFCDSEVD